MDLTPLKTQLAKSFLCVTAAHRWALLGIAGHCWALPGPAARPAVLPVGTAVLCPRLCLCVWLLLTQSLCFLRHPRDGWKRKSPPVPPRGLLSVS